MNNKPVVRPWSAWEYDIDSVDSTEFMFNHLCSGCVVFCFNDTMLSNGKVLLNGKEHNKWELTKFIFGEESILVVYVRGFLNDYDSKATITISGFTTADGKEIDSSDFEINVLPRRYDLNEKYSEHNNMALLSAEESAVLLKNDGVLPLKGTETLNFFGSGYSMYRNCACGAAKINPRISRSIKQAVEETSDFKLNNELHNFYVVPNNEIPTDEILENAKKNCDLGIMIITRGSGENIDNRPIKGEYYLSDKEELLIKKLSESFEKTIVVLNVGYPIDVRFIDKYNIKACLYTGFGGMFAAEALLNVLNGKVNPSAKMCDSWPLDYYDTPASKNFLNQLEGDMILQTDHKIWSQICYEEGLYIGYRYHTSFGKKAAFPFGFGLSYTSFKYECVKFDCTKESIDVSISVKNTGSVSGKAVVQLYVSKPNDCLNQVAVELCEFGKTSELTPNATDVLSFKIPKSHLSSYDSKNAQWKILKGNYNFYLGEDCTDLTHIGNYTANDDAVLKQVKNRVVPPIQFEELDLKEGKTAVNGENTFKCTEELLGHTEVHLPVKTDYKKPSSVIMFNDLLENPMLIEEFVNQFTDEQLCRLNVCWIDSDWSMNLKGIAGKVCGVKEYGMPEYVMTDGNSGVNLKIHNIGFLSSTSLACTFNKDMAYEVGRVIAEEALENDIDCILAPGMNIHRNILNGRHPEYFSEDPLLCGYMAGYFVKGLQDNGVSGSIKHVAANNCEALRKRSDSVISERTLREIYIKPYEYSLEIEKCDTIMTGYNAVNGKFCDECHQLTEDIFRDELGFDGFAMSDWNSYDTSDIVTMIESGISLVTPGSDNDKYTSVLYNALQNGKITRDELLRNIIRIVRVEVRRISWRAKLVKDKELLS